VTRVSVLTPSFGYARFLPDALDSVAAQRGIEVEHVVQDSCSTDGTVEVLAGRNGVVWSSEPDDGQSDALNRALERATGEWIGWLNADEFYLPDAIARLVEAGERTDADVVFGDAVFVDAGGRLLRLLPQHKFSPTVLRWYGATIPSCAALFRREALGVRPWTVGLRRIMDWDLYLTLAEQGARLAYLPMPAAAFRVHDAQVTSASAAESAAEYYRVAARHGLSWPTTHGPGRVLHGAMKLVGRAYGRQRAVAHVSGTDLRWFRADVGPGAALEVLERGSRYPREVSCTS